MAKSNRVVFTFDDKSLESLRKLVEDGEYGSMAEAVRDSLILNRTLQTQIRNGYEDVIVRDRKTGKERLIVMPSLTRE